MQVVKGIQLEKCFPASELALAQLLDLPDALTQLQGKEVSEPLIAAESGKLAFPW